MDPITAVGFAASILTFVDYAHKVVTGTIEVFKSGKTSKNVHISEVISDLKDASKDLTKVPPGRSEQQKALHELSASCHELGKELMTILEQLSTSPGQSKWTSVRVALRSMRKEGKVAEMESALDKYRSQILLRLIQIVGDQQLQLQVELCEFRTHARDQGSKTLDVLGALRTELVDAIETGLRDAKEHQQVSPTNFQGHDKSDSGTASAFVSLPADDQLARISELREALDQIMEKKDFPTPEMRILQQLWFDDIYVREDNIHNAEGSTFEWILDDAHGDEDADQEEHNEGNGVNPNRDEESDQIGGAQDADSTSDEGDVSDYSSSSSSQTNWPLNTEVLDLRAHTQSIFQEWLRQGNGIFHISGKAGSGKSTLVKLIVNDPRTYEFLEGWAGDKELVTAQFFFWRGGSDIQRSRQGLYRSLLFETLKQCPHLIQDVFPEAHKVFKQKSRENSIDRLFFRAEQIEAAFRKLVCLPSSLGCRMCLFVDGLDEYGDDDVDSYEYEKLAKNLITWTKNDDVKIMASSRPYREFMDKFSEDFRIHLHEINAYDIQSFSRQMFEADDQFSRVMDYYEYLVRRVVLHSAGVFLWARLVTRSLIASIHRGDPVESLDDQLEVTPKTVTKLYEYFFNSISKSDKEQAFGMLLLVAHCKLSFIDERFNALFCSWLEQLEDPDFPMAYDMKPYNDEEIQDRLHTINRRVAGLTHGLLEVTTAEQFPNSLFFGRTIRFFHRTARDFVLENPQLKRFHASHPSFTDPDTYLRLDIAELWFSKPGAIPADAAVHCMNLFNNYPEGRPAPGRLEAIIKVRMYHNADSSSPTFRARERIFERPPGLSNFYLPQPESHLHYILTGFRASDYLRGMAVQMNQPSKEQEDLSYILSATPNYKNSRSALENTRYLLSLGLSPMQRVLVRYQAKEDKDLISPDNTKIHATVWSIFIANLVYECYDVIKYNSDYLEIKRIWKILELFLEHGACGNTFCLLKDSWVSSTASHVISLRELIQQCSPSNERVLLRLIDKIPTNTFPSRLKEKFRNVRYKKLGISFDPLRYEPFHIDMWRQPHEFSEDESGEEIEYRYRLHSVWTENHETKVQRLTFRIC